MSLLTARETYRLWAPNYSGDNALCVLENQLATAMTPPLAGKRLLDAGCGVGLRLKSSGAAFAVGVDASPEMVATSGLATVAAADVRALPFSTSFFDMVWCRLMIGYLPDISSGYAELARVCRPGGHVLVTDFHADATRAGHRQTFRAADGELHETAHYAHTGADHAAAAAQQGLSLAEKQDGKIGPAIRSVYEQTGRLAMYERDRGLNVVAAFLFEKR